MHEYSVALRISGVKFDPAEVTARLGLAPTQVRMTGQPRPGGKSVWDEAIWEYEVWSDRRAAWPSLEEGLNPHFLFEVDLNRRMIGPTPVFMRF